MKTPILNFFFLVAFATCLIGLNDWPLRTMIVVVSVWLVVQATLWATERWS